MKTSLARLKRQPVHKSEKCYPSSCTRNDSEEEPPSRHGISDDIEEEPPSRPSTFGEMEVNPPGKAATTRYRFFGDIPDSVWNDWKWQFRNRISRIEQLAQFIPLSAEEQAQLKLVTIGLAIPTFVIDLPQGGGKVPLQPNYILAQTEGELVLRNYEERVFRHRNPRNVSTPCTACRGVTSVRQRDSALISRTSRSAGLGGTSRCG